jgi:hypothetical protein
LRQTTRIAALPDDRRLKLRRLSRYDLPLAERVLAGQCSSHKALIASGLVKPPPPPPPSPPPSTAVPSGVPRFEEPVDERVRGELAEAMGRESAAAAAIDAHRERRLAQEPPVR